MTAAYVRSKRGERTRRQCGKEETMNSIIDLIWIFYKWISWTNAFPSEKWQRIMEVWYGGPLDRRYRAGRGSDLCLFKHALNTKLRLDRPIAPAPGN